MSTTTANRLHYSDRTGRWMPCIAQHACWYSEHSTPLDLAKAGGAEVAINKRPQTITALTDGAYAIQTATRSQTFREDGSKMTPTEARAWRQAKAKAEAIAETVASGDVTHVPAAPKAENQDQLRKQKQLELVLEKNPMHDDYHVGIRTIEDIKTLKDAYADDVEMEENNAWMDQPESLYEEAFRTGRVTVYSSNDFYEGGFVSTSYNEAEQYARDGHVNSIEVPIEDVAWLSSSEGQYAPVNVAPESTEAPDSADVPAAPEPEAPELSDEAQEILGALPGD